MHSHHKTGIRVRSILIQPVLVLKISIQYLQRRNHPMNLRLRWKSHGPNVLKIAIVIMAGFAVLKLGASSGALSCVEPGSVPLSSRCGMKRYTCGSSGNLNIDFLPKSILRQVMHSSGPLVLADNYPCCTRLAWLVDRVREQG